MSRLPRELHPGAWWIWALGLGTAASRTTNPLLLLLILIVVVLVVVSRRSAQPWANGLRLYLILGLTVITIRIVFRVVLGVGNGATILFTLPELALPEIAAGVRIGGPVSLEGIVAATYDGLRLAVLLISVGAANLLADPRRLLKSMPGALYEVGTTVVLALTIAPQLVESVGRVSRARSLRGESRSRWWRLRATLLPVLEDALDRSIALAAGMDVRGYGRAAHVPVAARRRAAGLLITGLMVVCLGCYGVLDGTAPRWTGIPALLVGSGLATGGLRLAGRRALRSRYRPQRFAAPEIAVALSGVLAGAGMILAGRVDVAALFPSAQPLVWPVLPLAAAAAVLLASTPAWIAPPVPGRTGLSSAIDPRTPMAARPTSTAARQPAVVPRPPPPSGTSSDDRVVTPSKAGP